MTGFAAALRVSLAQPGLIQNVGALAGVTTPALGFVGFSGVENLIGTVFNDWFQGGAEANVLTGMRGADTLFGLGGADVLVGGVGNDSLIGGAGAIGSSLPRAMAPTSSPISFPVWTRWNCARPMP